MFANKQPQYSLQRHIPNPNNIQDSQQQKDTNIATIQIQIKQLNNSPQVNQQPHTDSIQTQPFIHQNQKPHIVPIGTQKQGIPFTTPQRDQSIKSYTFTPQPNVNERLNKQNSQYQNENDVSQLKNIIDKLHDDINMQKMNQNYNSQLIIMKINELQDKLNTATKQKQMQQQMSRISQNQGSPFQQQDQSNFYQQQPSQQLNQNNHPYYNQQAQQPHYQPYDQNYQQQNYQQQQPYFQQYPQKQSFHQPDPYQQPYQQPYSQNQINQQASQLQNQQYQELKRDIQALQKLIQSQYVNSKEIGSQKYEQSNYQQFQSSPQQNDHQRHQSSFKQIENSPEQNLQSGVQRSLKQSLSDPQDFIYNPNLQNDNQQFNRQQPHQYSFSPINQQDDQNKKQSQNIQKLQPSDRPIFNSLAQKSQNYNRQKKDTQNDIMIDRQKQISPQQTNIFEQIPDEFNLQQQQQLQNQNFQQQSKKNVFFQQDSIDLENLKQKMQRREQLQQQQQQQQSQQQDQQSQKRSKKIFDNNRIFDQKEDSFYHENIEHDQSNYQIKDPILPQQQFNNRFQNDHIPQQYQSDNQVTSKKFPIFMNQQTNKSLANQENNFQFKEINEEQQYHYLVQTYGFRDKKGTIKENFNYVYCTLCEQFLQEENSANHNKYCAKQQQKQNEDVIDLFCGCGCDGPKEKKLSKSEKLKQINQNLQKIEYLLERQQTNEELIEDYQDIALNILNQMVSSNNLSQLINDLKLVYHGLEVQNCCIQIMFLVQKGIEQSEQKQKFL